MSRRRVGPAVVRAALVHLSPFYCSVLQDELVFSLFSFEKYQFIHIYRRLPVSELFFFTVGAVQQNG